MAMDNRLLVPRYKYDPDAARYLAAVEAADGQALETPVRVAINTFFRDTKAAGVFSALNACCILAGARTLAGALVPVVGDAPTNVADAFVEGDYSRTDGLTGDGATTYLDSGRVGSDDLQDDCHISVYVTSPAGSSTRTFIGNSRSWVAEDDTTTYFRVNQLSSATVSGQNFTGLLGASRSTSTAIDIRANGASSSASVASVSQVATPTEIFRKNEASQYIDATLAFYSIGTSLDLEALETAVANLVAAIGAAV